MSMKDQLRRWKLHEDECFLNKIWISSTCQETPISEMNEQYISNCIAKLRDDPKSARARYIKPLLEEMHSRIGPLPDCFCSREIKNPQHYAEADCEHCPAMEYCK